MLPKPRDVRDEGKKMPRDASAYEPPVDLSRFIGATRGACLSWIKESGITWSDLSALTGIPSSRLRPLNLDERDLQSLARVLDEARPLRIEGVARQQVAHPDSLYEMVKDDEAWQDQHPSEWAAIKSSFEEVERRRLQLAQMSQPLVEAWAGASFIDAEVPDKRRLECQRCGYKWTSRKASPPKVCARCQSPYWNQGAPSGGE